MESLHALVLQERRKRELAEKNIAAKRRLQEIGGIHGQNVHINDLKNVSKVAESILNSKDLQKEYMSYYFLSLHGGLWFDPNIVFIKSIINLNITI